MWGQTCSHSGLLPGSRGILVQGGKMCQGKRAAVTHTAEGSGTVMGSGPTNGARPCRVLASSEPSLNGMTLHRYGDDARP